MKTEITSFYEALLRHLGGMPAALDEAVAKLELRSEFAEPRAALEDVRKRMRSLAEKLANQHAYLLIFGPLKSGKSTLMNAISGAYVSEVTSLPGYPALVFVQHAEQSAISVTHYNGRESIFTDRHVLKAVIADSHAALAQQIRAAEERGEEFDPRRHFNEAIRRIDIRMPVPTLAESGTVLVDTPGLYSRMNFGYDVLTREFRDTAACAVFVVKADNLFLEQVFVEFHQLLALFSRIFLVVNVDSGKRDLQPDGTLAPSAESADPQRIVDAFTTLSMAGPLREAYVQGRVRIHAVDLMHAAASVLAGGSRAEGDSFEVFQRDLTDYLNSTDYTREFIRDSLRQSQNLCEEVVEACTGAEVAELRARQEALTEELAALDARLAAFDRLLDADWRGSFSDVRVANVKRIARASEARVDELRASLEVALERWYESDHSLRSLEHQHWNPIVRNAGAALAEDAVKHLRHVLATPLGGAVPTDETLDDLKAVGFELPPIAKNALKTLAVIESAEPFRIPIKPEDVPVKKTPADWVALRRETAVSVRFFGEDRLEMISPEIKRQRLQEPSRIAFLRAIEAGLDERFPELPTRAASHQIERYIEKFCGELKQELEECRAKVERKRAEKRKPFEENVRVATAMKTLHERASEVRGEVLQLAEKESVTPLTGEGLVAVAFPLPETKAPTVVRKGATA